jgi:hypothetical protein
VAGASARDDTRSAPGLRDAVDPRDTPLRLRRALAQGHYSIGESGGTPSGGGVGLRDVDPGRPQDSSRAAGTGEL